MGNTKEEIELIYKARGKDALDFLKTYNANLNNTNSNLLKISNQADTFSNKAKYLSAGLSVAGLSSIKFAASLERQKKSYGVLLKDYEKGVALFDRLNTLSARTPLYLQDLTKQSQKLLSVGIIPDDIITKMIMLGNIALGDAQKFNTLTRAFARVKSKGKATLEELNFLTEAGIPIIAELAKYYDVTEQNIFKMITNGKVSFEDFDKVLQRMTSSTGMFHKGMEILADDVLGKASTALDNIKLSAADLGTIVLPTVSEILDGVTDVAQEFRSWDDDTKTMIITLGALGAAAAPAAKGLSLLSKSATWAMAHPALAIAGVAAVGIAALITNIDDAEKQLMSHKERTELLAKEYINLRDKTELNFEEQQRLKTVYSELKILSKELTDETLEQAKSYEEIAEAVKNNQIVDKKKQEYQELEKELQKYLKFTRDAQEEIKSLFDMEIDDTPKGPKMSQRELLSSDTGSNFWDDTEEGAIRVEERMQRIKEVLLSLKDDKGSNILGLELASKLATESEEKILEFLSKFSEDQNITKEKLRDLQKELIELQNPTKENKEEGGGDNKAARSWLKFREEMDGAREKAFRLIEKEEELNKRLGIEYDAAGKKQEYIKKQMQELISLNSSDVDYPFQPDGPTLTYYKQIYDEIEKSRVSLSSYSVIDGKVNEELKKTLELKEKITSTETLIIAARESGDDLRLGALQKIKKEYEDSYETIINSNDELTVSQKIEEEIALKLKEKTEESETLLEINAQIYQAQKVGDTERIQALEEIKNQLSSAVNEEIKLSEMAGEFGERLASVGANSLIDSFEAVGEAIAKGENGLDAMGDSLGSIAEASVNEIKSFAMEAGLKALCAGQWQLGIILLGIAGIAAVASGFMGASREIESGGISHVQQLLVDAERELVKQRVKALKEQMKLESEARDENMRKLDRYFNDELAVLRRALDNNLITQAEYTEEKNKLNTYYDEQVETIEAPYKKAQEEVDAEQAKLDAAEELQNLIIAVIEDKIAVKKADLATVTDGWLPWIDKDDRLKDEIKDLKKLIPDIRVEYDLEELQKIADEEGLTLPDMPNIEKKHGPEKPAKMKLPIRDGKPIHIYMQAPVYGIDDLTNKITTVAQRTLNRGQTWL